MAYVLHVCNQKICPSVVFDWYNLFESGPKCLAQVRPMPCLQNPSTNYFNVYNDDICWQTGSCKLKNWRRWSKLRIKQKYMVFFKGGK